MQSTIRVGAITAVALVLGLACGGGGGGGGGGNDPLYVRDITNLLAPDSQEVILGTLEPGDEVLLDHTYADFFSFTLDGATELQIALNSVDFDSYLYLFTDDCLDLPLSQWDACFIAEDDDSGSLPDDAFLNEIVGAGNYVLVANTFFQGESGNYSLEVTLLDPGGFGAAQPKAGLRPPPWSKRKGP